MGKFQLPFTIKRAELISKLSLNKVLLKLSRIFLHEYMDEKKAYTEISKKIEKIISELNIDILPKI